MTPEKISRLGAFELAAKIKNGELTSVGVVDAHIARIQEVNPKLNALVEERFTQARKEARANDKLKNKSDRPLAGVPFTVKEMIAVEGLKSTLGSVHRKEGVQRRDATVVERLRAAGAILLGATNVPEVGFWFECNNPVYGRSNNPYDLSRTPGGSTGGECALLACGATPFGLGSDVGGSIRIPAFFCGVFGHKPSNGIIPFTGHAPMYHDNAARFVNEFAPLTALGPLTKKAADLYPLMQILIGEDGFDLEMKKNFKLKPLLSEWKDKKVYVLPSPRIHGASETEKDVADSVTQASRYFRELGAKIIELDEDIFLRGFKLWTAEVSAIQGMNFNDYLSPSGPIGFKKEFFKFLIGQGDYTLPSLITAALEKNAAKKMDGDKLRRELAELKISLTQKLGTSGILLMPSHPRKAPKHTAPLLTPFDFTFTAIINALKLPSTACPMGLAKNGLPLGLQIVAAEDQDHLTLSAALALESAFGGWVMADVVG